MNNKVNVLFYLVGLYFIGVAISMITRVFIEFVPYFIAGGIAVMPLYGYVKEVKYNTSFSYSAFVRHNVKRLFNNASFTIVVLVVVFRLRATLFIVLGQSLLLSTLGFAIVGVCWTIARALLKHFKKQEIPSFIQAVKSAL